MNKYFKIAALFVAAAISVANAAAQEWEVIETYSYDNDTSIFWYEECTVELANGNFFVSSTTSYKSGAGDFYSEHPAVALISSNGQELARNEFFRPGLCTTTTCPYLFENNGNIYMLTTYSPDHDSTYFNYFGDCEIPPTDAILGLYMLDDKLDIKESYEHIYPIDVYENRDMMEWQYHPNFYSGNIFLYSAFEDEGYITGAYFKTVSYADVPRGQDSLFFFKMDFEGNFLLKKGYELQSSGSPMQYAYQRQQMVKSDNGYIIYTKGSNIDYHGDIEYYDNEFNHLTTKYLIQPGHDPETMYRLSNISVKRSSHNTTYLSTEFRKKSDGDKKSDVRLYEIDDDISDNEEKISVLRYIERYTDDHDRAAPIGVDIAVDGNIYFAYTLNVGFMYDDSWIMIEKLDANFDTISTFFYDQEWVYNNLFSMKATCDGGVILVSYSQNLDNGDKCSTTITKFPASAFVSIEEAHAHNLKVAVAYPNPGGDVMNVRTSLLDCIFQVYDMQGRMVHQQEITDDVTSVDASNWPSGTYVWKLGMRNEELGMKEIETGKWVK
jgi:hypothetical protein